MNFATQATSWNILRAARTKKYRVFCLPSTRPGPHRIDLCLNVCLDSFLRVCPRDAAQQQYVSAREPRTSQTGDTLVFLFNVQWLSRFMFLLVDEELLRPSSGQTIGPPFFLKKKKYLHFSPRGYVLKLSPSHLDASGTREMPLDILWWRMQPAVRECDVDCVSCHGILFLKLLYRSACLSAAPPLLVLHKTKTNERKT